MELAFEDYIWVGPVVSSLSVMTSSNARRLAAICGCGLIISAWGLFLATAIDVNFQAVDVLVYQTDTKLLKPGSPDRAEYSQKFKYYWLFISQSKGIFT